MKKKIENKNPDTKSCEDPKCPIHGKLSLRGQELVGMVSSRVFHKTTTVTFERQTFDKKYKRYEKNRTKIKAYVPTCIEVKVGDIVKIAECRPLSKTKNFVLIEKIKKEQ